MTTTAFIYFILQWTTFFILFQCGKRMDNLVRIPNQEHIHKDFWSIAMVPIVAYALFLGLRWGRDIDYNVYAERYDAIDSIFAEESNSSPLFACIVLLCKALGISYPVFIILQCAFLMFSALLFLSDYLGYLKWILPMLLVAFSSNDNLIRFFLAQSFMFIGLYYYTHEKYLKFSLFSICACLSHLGLAPFVMVIALSKFLNNLYLPRSISILIYAYALFFVNISDMRFLVVVSSNILSLFGESDFGMIGYLEGMDDIINGTGEGGTLLFEHSFTNKIKSFLTFVPLILYGQNAVVNIKNGKYIYNLAVISLIIGAVFGQAEILSRYIYSFNIFIVIALAALIYHWKVLGNHLQLFYSYLLFFLYCYALVTAPFAREDYQMYFLWDSNGSITNWAPYHNIMR